MNAYLVVFMTHWSGENEDGEQTSYEVPNHHIVIARSRGRVRRFLMGIFNLDFIHPMSIKCIEKNIPIEGLKEGFEFWSYLDYQEVSPEKFQRVITSKKGEE